MKKLWNYSITLLALSGLVLLNSCGTDPEPPDATLPTPDGTVQIDFLNYPNNTASNPINAVAGDIVSVAVRMTKSPSGTRPQKLRIYETRVLDTRGTQVKISGQGNSEGTIDLRNLDEQVKNINYTVPGQNGALYLYFEVDESGGKFSRKVLTINVGGVGGINAWTGVILGASGNSEPSTMSSATGRTYKVEGGAESDAAANIADIDITYIESVGSTGPWLTSYPARSQSPFNITAANISGASPTYFDGTTLTAAQFDAISTADALTQGIGTEPNSVQYHPPTTGSISAGSVIKFKNGRGKAGLIKVTAITPGRSGTITLDVKVKR